MISKFVKLLLISAMLCSAVVSITLVPITLHENTPMKETFACDSADSVYPTLILIGDPIEGGGTPTSGNQTGY